MPGLAMDAIGVDRAKDDSIGDCPPIYKRSYSQPKSPRSTLSPQTPRSDSIDLALDGVLDTSIEQLYHNVCEMQSSDPSPSRGSFLSYGEESRIDSELCHLAGDIGEMETVTKDVVVTASKEEDSAAVGHSTPKEADAKKFQKSVNKDRSRSASIKKQLFKLQSDSMESARTSPRCRPALEKPPVDRRNVKSTLRKPNAVKKQKNLACAGGGNFLNGVEDPLDAGLDNPDLGPFLLKQTRNMIALGENPRRALEFAVRAMKSFEACANGKPNLEHVMCLHILAALNCSLGRYNEAVPMLERSIEIPVIEEGENHALAKFAGCMQLGDTYVMLGQMENAILCYIAGLEIQRQVLGETDPRFGETCRYVAEAHVQALQLNEAEKLCQMALDIHKEKDGPASLEEAADRRLMGLICDAKGDHEAALEHYVLASMAMSVNGQDADVASVDCSIGDAYLSLTCYDEAVFAYQKALNVFKSSKGENDPVVASVYVRLADLYNKTGKFRDSRSYCENALRIYEKPNPGTPQEEIANGLIDISCIYQSMNELDQALKLLRKAQKIYGDSPGQQTTVAGIESQMGVMYYMMGNFEDSYKTFHDAISKFRASGEKKSALFGIALNQMGLTCVQRYAINEAAELFEEARSILEKEYGPCHPDTLGVYSNLAGTYDAMGRLEDAIEILDYVVVLREEKLGTGNPDVDDEKRRLAELLKDAGRARNKKSKSLVTLLDTKFQLFEKDDGIQVS